MEQGSLLDGSYWTIPATSKRDRSSKRRVQPLRLPSFFFESKKRKSSNNNKVEWTEEKKKMILERREKVKQIEREKIEQENERNQLKLRRLREGFLVLDRVLVGGKGVAKDKDILEEHNVVAVLNITSSVPNYYENTFVYKRVNVQDSSEQPIEVFFHECSSFINDHIGEDKRVLVHCEMGLSRSPTIVIAWIMYQLKKTFEEAYQTFLSVVGEDNVSINTGFQQQLMNWESSLNQPTDVLTNSRKRLTRKNSGSLSSSGLSVDLSPTKKRRIDVEESSQ